MYISTKAILLHKTKYGDNSLIVKLFTEKTGTQSFIIKNAFSKKSKFHYTLFSSLALLEITYNQRKSGEIQFLKDIRIAHHFTQIPFDIVRNTILLFYNEILYKLLFQYGEDAVLYQFMEGSILEIDKQDVILSDIHIKFLVSLSCLVGFAPQPNHTNRNAYFSIQNACFLDAFHLGDSLSQEASLYLFQILSHLENPQTVAPAPKTIRTELLYGLVKYFEIHNEGIKKIESLEILSQILLPVQK